MAGFYPDVPGPRIPYDLDGTAVFLDPVMTTAATTAQIQGLNSSALYTINRGFTGTALTLLLPRPLDLVGLMVGYNSGLGETNAYVKVSSDTTNGIDGNWRSVAVTAKNNTATTVFRTGISAVSQASVVGIQVTYLTGDYNGVANLHLYGQPSIVSDRLAFWDPASDTALGGAALDFGDVPQGNVNVKTFRVKNLSSTLTANSISLSDNTLTDATPSIPPQYDYSIDGGTTYSQTPNIGNLAPGAISSVITVRKTTPSNAALSLHWLRTTASAASWS